MIRLNDKQNIEVTMKKQFNIDGFTVQHLPIISAYARRIGVLDTINTLKRAMPATQFPDDMSRPIC